MTLSFNPNLASISPHQSCPPPRVLLLLLLFFKHVSRFKCCTLRFVLCTCMKSRIFHCSFFVCKFIVIIIRRYTVCILVGWVQCAVGCSFFSHADDFCWPIGCWQLVCVCVVVYNIMYGRWFTFVGALRYFVLASDWLCSNYFPIWVGRAHRECRIRIRV